MPREDEGVQAGRVCRAWIAGACENGDGCVFSHGLQLEERSTASSTTRRTKPEAPPRETIGSRAAAAAQQSDTSSGRGSTSSSQGRSWADQSEDSWLELDAWPAGTAAGAPGPARPAGPEGGERRFPSFDDRIGVGEWRLPGFGDRLDFPEYFPSACPAELCQKKSRAAVRRKKRELADRRTEFSRLNTERADRAVVAALALRPFSLDLPPLHLDFPRSEAESPRRPPPPWPTPRPPDRPSRDRASDSACVAEEEDEVEEHWSGPARPGSGSTKLSL